MTSFCCRCLAAAAAADALWYRLCSGSRLAFYPLTHPLAATSPLQEKGDLKALNAIWEEFQASGDSPISKHIKGVLSYSPP